MMDSGPAARLCGRALASTPFESSVKRCERWDRQPSLLLICKLLAHIRWPLEAADFERDYFAAGQRAAPSCRRWKPVTPATVGSQATATRLLRKRSPLMLHVSLEQIRRARSMSLADELRMERDMVRHVLPACAQAGAQPSETVEGIRALAMVDKDHASRAGTRHASKR